ncbi:MAG: hypothetical protein HGA65_03150 [Oscillochloris sp.]|nr:hypothetical protein [Oscillochloris sp.]
MTDPMFNTIRLRRATAGAVEDLLTFDTVDALDGNGAALRFVNNTATEGLSLVLGRFSARRVDATTVQLDLAVILDPTVSTGDETLPLLSLTSGASGRRVSVSGPLSVSGHIDVVGTVDGRDVSADGLRLDQHLANNNNPHNTTAAQVGALSLSGGTLNGSLTVKGTVSIGTSTPQRTLHVEGSEIHSGGSGAGFSFSNRGSPFIDSGGNGDRWVWYAFNKLARLWSNGDKLFVTPDGNMGIGLAEPRNQLHVLRGIASGLDFNSPGSITFYPPDGFAWFHIDNGPAGGRPIGRLRISHGGTPGRFELVSITQGGDVEILGRLIARNKIGFVADQFINNLGATLEAGDVVIISENQGALFYAPGNNLPVPEVVLAQQAYDSRVCGIVVEAFAAGQPAPPETLGANADEPAPIVTATSSYSLLETGQPMIAPGQIGLMVTQGAFTACKVDAQIAPIRPGDLLTTSPTPGHAQKVLDRSQATGAILGKALGGLDQGQGTIPVMVLLQ